MSTRLLFLPQARLPLPLTLVGRVCAVASQEQAAPVAEDRGHHPNVVAFSAIPQPRPAWLAPAVSATPVARPSTPRAKTDTKYPERLDPALGSLLTYRTFSVSYWRTNSSEGCLPCPSQSLPETERPPVTASFHPGHAAWVSGAAVSAWCSLALGLSTVARSTPRQLVILFSVRSSLRPLPSGSAVSSRSRAGALRRAPSSYCTGRFWLVIQANRVSSHRPRGPVPPPVAPGTFSAIALQARRGPGCVQALRLS